MTAADQYVWVSLMYRSGWEFMRARIPANLASVHVLQYGARFFVLQSHTGQYHETDCWFITPESQYGGPREPLPPPAKKANP
jgi:hypothetical protein